jgi:TRAP-type mannitol/chloroaromatic compound transport system permease small subunit
MRYLLQSGSVAAQELEWHLFALIILLGAGYTLKHDEHVRVDLLYASSRLSDRHRALIDIIGNLCFLLPFAVLVVWSSLPFAYSSFVGAEVSPDPGGLTNRWLLKAAIPFGFMLLALQALANSSRAILKLLSER